MRTLIVAVGRLRPPYQDDVQHYRKMLARYANVDAITPDGVRTTDESFELDAVTDVREEAQPEETEVLGDGHLRLRDIEHLEEKAQRLPRAGFGGANGAEVPPVSRKLTSSFGTSPSFLTPSMANRRGVLALLATSLPRRSAPVCTSPRETITHGLAS